VATSTTSEQESGDRSGESTTYHSESGRGPNGLIADLRDRALTSHGLLNGGNPHVTGSPRNPDFGPGGAGSSTPDNRVPVTGTKPGNNESVGNGMPNTHGNGQTGRPQNTNADPAGQRTPQGPGTPTNMPGQPSTSPGNGLGNTLGTFGSGIGNLVNGLLGNSGSIPLSLLRGGIGGIGDTLLNTATRVLTPIATSTAPVIPNIVNQATTTSPSSLPAGNSSTGGNASAHASNPTSIAASLPQASIAPAATRNIPNMAPNATNYAHAPANSSTTPQLQAPIAGNMTLARAATNGSVAEAPNSAAAASATRTSATDLPQSATTTAMRQGSAIDPSNANAMPAGTSNAGRAATPASPALAAIQTGVLTLVVAPHVQAENDENGGVTHMALFRGQNVEGQENLRDILGRSYVFNADGKLATRAEERRAIDPIGTADVDQVNELSASNHGELSTHELVWKVVVPAFVGVGALLGGATVGVATAAGSTGVAGSILLAAATGIFGYGAARATAALREMADSGTTINPIDNKLARQHWIAAGSQSVAGFASLAMLLL
jgi:hypothetical protein